MAWRKDATERRAIWPYPVFENQIKLEVSGVLVSKSGGRASAPADGANLFHGKNWMREKNSLNSAFLNWKVYQESAPWDRMQLELTMSMHKPELFLEHAFPSGKVPQCVFAIDALCK
ncbi:MAG TPA: hypothetical protein VJ521_03470, partial [Acidobacteriota bacterium]|nr:hypothetical protein [Acidobacteriota bacterium]